MMARSVEGNYRFAGGVLAPAGIGGAIADGVV